jgi:hypothetical protein
MFTITTFALVCVLSSILTAAVVRSMRSDVE